MSHWSTRSQVLGDVVLFSSATSAHEKSATEVMIWDLDKTYLDTRIDSLSGLLNAILERALNKKNIPGTDTLLRTLADEHEKKTGQSYFPIYFITASPPQIEERISEKFVIDKIRPFGCFYKDNLKNLRPGRFWRLTKQIGYKLQALMQLRTRLNEQVKQICFGDDSENDVIIYNLYSDICSRRLTSGEIRSILSSYSVSGDQVDLILDLQAQVPENDPVEKIYINLATDTDPEYYLKYGRRTLATTNTYQLALDLFQDRRLTFEGLCDVATDMVEYYGLTIDELTKSLDEMFSRSILSRTTWERLETSLRERELIYKGYAPQVHLHDELEVTEGRVRSLAGHHEPWVNDKIEY